MQHRRAGRHSPAAQAGILRAALRRHRRPAPPQPEPPLAPTRRREPPMPRGLSAHILPTSATMIGVCMTVLSIGHLRQARHSLMLVDQLLAIDALVFLGSAVLSFMSMRSHRAGRPQRYESWAEALFLLGLGALALGALMLAFAIE